jgi:hypothetical protein
MMKTPEEIESRFAEIAEHDDSGFICFYHENQDYFSLIDPTKQDSIQDLWMLSRIIESVLEKNDGDLIKRLVRKTLGLYTLYSASNDYDLSGDSIYKSLLLMLGTFAIEQENYCKAEKYLGELVKLDDRNSKLLDLYKDVKIRYIRKVGRISGMIGFIFLLFNYAIRLVFVTNGLGAQIPGYLGACFLIAFGIVEIYLIRYPAKG